MKKIYRLSWTFLAAVIVILNISGCTFEHLRKPTAENPRPGAVSFCMIYRESRTIGEHITGVYGLNFVQSVGGGKYTGIEGFEDDPYAKSKERNVLRVNGDCFVVTNLRPGVNYSLNRMMTSYEEGDTQYIITIELDPVNFHQSIPITVESGKIKFLGIFAADAIIVQKAQFLGPKEKRAVKIVDGNPILTQNPLAYAYRMMLYGKFDQNNAGAEKNLMTALLRYHPKEGYWHDLILKRMKELGIEPKEKN